MYLNIVTVLCLVMASVTAVNYCGDLKCHKTPHVACNNPLAKGRWSSRCSSEVSQVKITPRIQQLILDQHNKYRNQQAMGRIPHYQPATRMATLTWDPELAELAAINVRQCEMKHDKCRNTAKYPFAGQNLASSSTTGRTKSDAGEFEDAIKRWFENEHPNGKYWGWMKIINEHKSLSSNQQTQVGHFTQVVRDEAHAVGCAAARWKEGKKSHVLVACDYSRTNLLGRSIYKAGATASECRTDRNAKYPGLCSEREQYKEPYAG